MTGFAEKTFDFGTGTVRINIRTLNHRYLDWSYRGTSIGCLEDRLRALCQKKLHRGRIEVIMDIRLSAPEKWDFRINEGLLKKIFSSLRKATFKLPEKVSFSVENLLNVPQLVEFRRKDFTREEEDILEEGFEKTLDLVIKAREREGRAIRRQLRGHIKNLQVRLRRVEGLAKNQPVLIRQKLQERLEELDQEKTIPESKRIEEASFLAQRYDLTEEVTRLKSHVAYAAELIEAQDREPAGRKLDFVAQELYREANTINSKAQDIALIQECLAIKAEVESIRQQVQNVE